MLPLSHVKAIYWVHTLPAVSSYQSEKSKDKLFGTDIKPTLVNLLTFIIMTVSDTSQCEGGTAADQQL